MNTFHQSIIEKAFLFFSETMNSYINEAIDASLDYDYFNLSSQLSTASISSIYYSSLSIKPLLNSIKINAILITLTVVHSHMDTQQSKQPRIFLIDDLDYQHKI